MIKRFAIGLATLVLAAGFAFGQTTAPGVNGSALITTGLTYQNLLAAAGAGVRRRSLTIENNNTNSDDCWIEVTGLIPAGSTTSTSVTPTGGSAPAAMAASKASILLTAHGGAYHRSYPLIPDAAIVGTCTTTGDTLYVDTQ